jgi:D-serine deaminase-like pyridoxal phosphate-dependent protein
MSWFIIENVQTLDSPALVIYKERVAENIRLLTGMVKSVDQLRPHVKTNKIAEVCNMMMEQGITKFKCATIAEAEMLAMVQAPDVLLAYQPIGPKAHRLLKLIEMYPQRVSPVSQMTLDLLIIYLNYSPMITGYSMFILISMLA